MSNHSSVVRILLACGGFLVVASGLHAQGDEVDRQQDERIDALENRQNERIEALENKNAALEAEVGDLRNQLDEQGYDEEEGYSGIQTTYEDVSVVFQIFGDVGWNYEHPAIIDDGDNFFYLGSLSFVINASFGDNYRTLSETVLEGKRDDKISTSVERLWGQWIYDDSFAAKVGTEHNPISRWNQLYHHGRWLETSIDRPILAYFEGEQGILPLHRTGVELSGSFQGESGRWEYFAFVSNGRGEEPSDKQRTSDANDQKAVDAGLAYQFFGVADFLRLGCSVTVDKIPDDEGSTDPRRAHSIHEYIAAANAQWRQGPVEVLSEYAFIKHDVVSGGEYYNNTGYVQVAYMIDDWTPYSRIGYRTMDEGDPFYMSDNRDLDLWLSVLGVRVDLTPNLAVKTQFSYGRGDERSGSGSISDEDIYAVGFQLSWWL